MNQAQLARQMNQIYLVRHGQTTAETRSYESIAQPLVDFRIHDFGDEPLTDYGKGQVKPLAESIKRTFKPDGNYYIFTSPAKRCVDTSMLLAHKLEIRAGGGHSMVFKQRNSTNF